MKVAEQKARQIELDILSCNGFRNNHLDLHHEHTRSESGKQFDAHAQNQVCDCKEEKSTGCQLGSAKGARYRTYERLKRYVEHERDRNPLLVPTDLPKAIDEIYRYPLRQSAIDTLSRRFKDGIEDEQLASLVLALRTDHLLCIISEDEREQEPQIICSMGIFQQ